MHDIAFKLCILATVGLLSVGVLALVSPRRLSRSYGVEVTRREAFVYVRATGARDIILGILLGLGVLRADVPQLIAICAAGVALSLTDFVLAITFSRRLRSEHGAHLGGAIAFLIITILLIRS